MRLIDYLKETGQSQQEFAAKIDARQATVSRWCDGSMMPRPAMMARIVAATGGAVTPADFYPAPALLQETGKQELAA
jgi:transcriptional regulator with XRE-family HTH domain